MRCTTCGRLPTEACCTECHRAQAHAEQEYWASAYPIIDETGNRHGRLTVVEAAGRTSYGAAQWLCRCDCGNSAVVIGSNLRAGVTKACGCLQRERARELGRRRAREAADA